jgi:hypothetical protein
MFFCFASQQIKKQKKKPKTTKEKQDCTPQGGSSGTELGLVISFFSFFLFCIAIAEMPGRNCQWFQSSDVAT